MIFETFSCLTINSDYVAPRIVGSLARIGIFRSLNHNSWTPIIPTSSFAEKIWFQLTWLDDFTSQANFLWPLWLAQHCIWRLLRKKSVCVCMSTRFNAFSKAKNGDWRSFTVSLNDGALIFALTETPLTQRAAKWRSSKHGCCMQKPLDGHASLCLIITVSNNQTVQILHRSLKIKLKIKLNMS